MIQLIYRFRFLPNDILLVDIKKVTLLLMSFTRSIPFFNLKRWIKLVS